MDARSPNRYQDRIDYHLLSDDRSTRITQSAVDYYELFQEQLTLYNQVDLSQIKQNTTILNAKDLEREGKNIAETLGNKKNDWAKRTKAILTIQSCLVTPHLLKLPQIYSFLSAVTEGLSIQLFDLRSAITKEACKTISLISEVLQNEFDHQAGNTFVKDISLFKLMESANHVMAEHAHLSVISILYNTCSQKVIKNVLKQALDRHQQIRIYCAEYILLFLLLYPKSILDKFVYDFQAYLIKAIQDSNAEVRRKARLVFIKFNHVYPEESRELFQSSVSITYQKVIFEDFDSYGLQGEKQNIFNDDLHATIQDGYQPNNFDPMNRSVLGQSLVLLGSNGESIQDSVYYNNDQGHGKSKAHNFKNSNNASGHELKAKQNSRQGITSPMSEFSNQSGMRKTMPSKMSTMRSPDRNERKHNVANVPKQSIMQSVRSTLLAFNNKYSVAPGQEEQNEIAERFQQNEPDLDDSKSTSTYMSMTGRRSPGNMKRTTFTKDIRQSEKVDSVNNSHLDSFQANTNNIVKRYTISVPGMKSPQRTRIPDMSGRGSPKPNRDQKARINTGLAGMGSPQRSRGDQQNNRSSYKISTTQSQMAQSTNSGTKIQNSSKFEQLKRNHYTNAKISGRRSPGPQQTVASPTSPTEPSPQASNNRQKHMKQHIINQQYGQMEPQTPTELQLSDQQQRSENNIQAHTQYIKSEKERGQSKIGKGLSYQKQPLRPGSTQVQEDDSMYKSKNLVQQIEPQLQTIQTYRQVEDTKGVDTNITNNMSISGRSGPTTAPRRSKYIRSMITQHGEGQQAQSQKKEQPPSPRFLSPESTKGENYPQQKIIPQTVHEMPETLESTGKKASNQPSPAQNVNMLDLGVEYQKEHAQKIIANHNALLIGQDIGSHLQVEPSNMHKVNFSMQIPRNPQKQQNVNIEETKNSVVMSDCNLLTDSKIDIMSAVNTQQSQHQSKFIPQQLPAEEEEETDALTEPIPSDLTLRQYYD